VIVISRPRRHAHADQHDARCQDVARELESRGDHRCGLCQEAGDDVAAGEEATDGDARASHPTGRLVRLIDWGHGRIVFRHASIRRTLNTGFPEDNRAGQQHGIDRDAQREHANDSLHQGGGGHRVGPGFRIKTAHDHRDSDQ